MEDDSGGGMSSMRAGGWCIAILYGIDDKNEIKCTPASILCINDCSWNVTSMCKERVHNQNKTFHNTRYSQVRCMHAIFLPDGSFLSTYIIGY